MTASLRSVVKAAYQRALRAAFPGEARALGRARRAELDRAARYLAQAGYGDGLAGRSLAELSREWSDYIDQHFDPRSPQSFYEGWNGRAGALNVLINIHDQFSRLELRMAMQRVLSARRSLSVLDIGCGTAALYWDLIGQHRFTLVDFPNLAQDYVRHKAGERPNVRVTTPDELATLDTTYDVVFIIDVLEHLETPSAMFRDNVDARLARGGRCLVQAPWGGIPEHIEAAPRDWFANGGDALLRTGYRLVRPVNHLLHLAPRHLSGLYEKR